MRISPNVEPRRNGMRPTILLLHYTGLESMAKAIDWLCLAGSGVSCHYGIDEDGRITQMVAEDLRAWHAGESIWDGESDINSASIGIEIHNPGHDFGYPDFPDVQMQAVERAEPGYRRAPRHQARSACWPIPTWRRRARRTPARSSPGRGWRAPASATGCRRRR